MQATIYYPLSDAGQLDALRRGLPAGKHQTTTCEVTPDDLDLATIGVDGSIHISFYGHGNTTESVPKNPYFYSSITLDSVPEGRAAVDDLRARVEKAKADEEAQTVERLTNLLARADQEILHAQDNPESVPSVYDLHHSSGSSWWGPAIKRFPKDHPYFALREQRGAEQEKRNQIKNAEREAREAREKAEKAEREAREAAKEVEKNQFITTWITWKGTDSQLARQSEGLLPREEAVKAIAEFALDFLADWPEAPDPESDCQNSEACGGEEDREEYACKTETSDRKHEAGISEEQYAALTRLRAVPVPQDRTATYELWDWNAWHDCNHDDCHTGTVTGVKSSVAYGPFTFTRTCAL